MLKLPSRVGAAPVMISPACLDAAGQVDGAGVDQPRRGQRHPRSPNEAEVGVADVQPAAVVQRHRAERQAAAAAVAVSSSGCRYCKGAGVLPGFSDNAVGSPWIDSVVPARCRYRAAAELQQGVAADVEIAQPRRCRPGDDQSRQLGALPVRLTVLVLASPAAVSVIPVPRIDAEVVVADVQPLLLLSVPPSVRLPPPSLVPVSRLSAPLLSRPAVSVAAPVPLMLHNARAADRAGAR